MKRHKVYTLEIEKPTRRHLTAVKDEAEVSVEVDFDLTGFIYEIRVWSDFVNMFVPVDAVWFVKNCISKYTDIEQRVRATIGDALSSKYEYNNNEPA